MNHKLGWLSREAVFFFLVGIVWLGFAAVWRLIFILRNYDSSVEAPLSVLAQSFVVGARFDSVMIAYVIAPLLLLSVIPYLEISRNTFWRRLLLGILCASAAVVFLVHLVDLEFFAFFHQRLNGMALTWSDTPGMMMSLVWDTYPVIRWLLLWGVMTAGFVWVVYRLSHHWLVGWGCGARWANLVWLPVMLALLFLAGRGRIADLSPIRSGVAFFSQYNLPNQAALNPAFTFWRDAVFDARDKQTQAAMFARLSTDNDEATTRRLLEIPDSLAGQRGGRIFRPVHFDRQNPDPPNVMLIMLESFGSTKIGALDNRYAFDLSPRFDSLANHGILFTNFYSTGMHTYTGIFSCLTGGMHQFTELIMKQLPGMAQFYALPAILRDRGYETIAFTTHDPHFDNFQGFVKANGVNRVISDLDLDDNDKLGMWGVPDHVLFDRASLELPEIDEPWFAFILTTSNHGPWLIPPADFDHIPGTVASAEELNAFKYSDWALGRFIDDVLPNLENTIVVITADNGYPSQTVHDLELTQYQIPLLILDSENRLAPRRIDRVGSQLDMLATIMGLVQLDYDDYSFGHNLLDTTRRATDFAIFSEWHKLGYVERDYYYIQRLRGGPETFCRTNNPAVNLADSLPRLTTDYGRKALGLFCTGYYNQLRPLHLTPPPDQRPDPARHAAAGS